MWLELRSKDEYLVGRPKGKVKAGIEQGLVSHVQDYLFSSNNGKLLKGFFFV